MMCFMEHRPTARRRRFTLLLVMTGLPLLALTQLSGCNSLGYYRQAVAGQWSLLRQRTEVQTLLAAPTTDANLKTQLEKSQQMLAFIETELGLAVEQQYRSYVQLARSAVVYNLVAVPQLSLEPKRWCYPIVGCAPYRGYFSEVGATAYAAELQAAGYVTYIGEVPAYSTLGWFRDPLLSTFIDWPDGELIALLAHEIAHSKVWIPSDVPLNEAFASFVGREAARQWLLGRAPQGLQNYAQRQRQWRGLLSLMLDLKAQLRSRSADAAGQRLLYQTFYDCYAAHRQVLGAGRFDAYVKRLNNAALAAVATYEDWVPAFARLFEEQQNQWPAFYAAVGALGELDSTARKLKLNALAKEQIASSTDDGNTHQIQCEALSHHAIDRDSVGTVDNDIRRRRHG